MTLNTPGYGSGLDFWLSKTHRASPAKKTGTSSKFALLFPIHIGPIAQANLLAQIAPAVLTSGYLPADGLARLLPEPKMSGPMSGNVLSCGFLYNDLYGDFTELID